MTTQRRAIKLVITFPNGKPDLDVATLPTLHKVAACLIRETRKNNLDVCSVKRDGVRLIVAPQPCGAVAFIEAYSK